MSDIKTKIMNKYEEIFVLVLAIILLLIYGNNIRNICTVWQFGDEAGYLANCAYLLGYDWDDVRAVTPYYGYGYSIALIPIFIMAQNGVALIQGAVGINIICVLGIYFLQIYILKNIYGKNKKITYAGIAFISCICPYIVANAYMVVCEVFLTFWFWLLVLLLYKAVEKRKTIYFVVLGICSAYSFFIHTRAIVVIIAIIGTVFVLLISENNKTNIKCFICLFFTIIIFSLIFYGVKAALINSAQILYDSVSESTNSVNLITPTYLFERLKWLFSVKNIKYYFLSLIAKIFYIICATGGMAIYGFVELFSYIKGEAQEDNLSKDSGKYVCVFFILCASLMVVICTLNGAGSLENFTTFFYNRYFEFTIWPLFSVGTYQFVSKKQCIKKIMWSVLLLVLVCILTMQLSIFMSSSEIHLDVFRIAAFSDAVKKNRDFVNMILYLAMTTLLVICINYVLNFRYRSLILIVLVLFIGSSSLVNIETIIGINEQGKSDAKIAEYILGDDNYINVYMINEPYKYSGFYSRMQVLVKNRRLYVIEPDEINNVNSGDYILTYFTTEYHDKLLEDSECIMRDGIFYLYKKR